MQSRDNALNQMEFNQLFNACGDAKDKILVILLGGLGMRASEVANMRAGWINWQQGRIHIPSREGNWKPKTEHSSRTIPFAYMPRAKAIISHYFALNDRIKASRIAIYKRTKNIAERTGIHKKVTPHSLRATAGYMFAEAGLSAQALRQVMGWAKLETAQRYIVRSGRASERELEEHKDKLWI